MRESGARGLLVYDVKFCEPELFDLPQLRDRLSPSAAMLHVEFETATTIAQQTLNRIEAFVRCCNEPPAQLSYAVGYGW